MNTDSFLSDLDQLFRQKRYFELRDELAKHSGVDSEEFLLYRGAVANKFNRMQESNEFLQSYLETAKPTGEKLRNCYELLGDNYAKSYQYKLAGEKFGWLFENCADEYTGEQKQHLEYLNNVWNAFGDVPPQTISFSDDSRIKAKRIQSDHLEIPLQINGQNSEFVFDTGANLSCITISNANKFGFQIIDRDISVGTSTDLRIDSKLAVADTLKFGNITLENVIFLVLKDEDLYFNKFEHQMNGIIGYPVLQACRQVSVSTNNEFFIPSQISDLQNSEQNLCFDDMLPLLNIVYKNQPMTFVFDTGGRKSQFWSKFLKHQEAEIIKNARLKMTDFGGAGGRRSIPAYILDELPIDVFGKEIRFMEAQILSEPFNDLNRNFFGNIGQDFMMQFEKMTIDFYAPGVVFE